MSKLKVYEKLTDILHIPNMKTIVPPYQVNNTCYYNKWQWKQNILTFVLITNMWEGKGNTVPIINYEEPSHAVPTVTHFRPQKQSKIDFYCMLSWKLSKQNSFSELLLLCSTILTVIGRYTSLI